MPCSIGGITDRANCALLGGTWTEPVQDTDYFGYPIDYNTGPQGEVYNAFTEQDKIADAMNRKAGMSLPRPDPRAHFKEAGYITGDKGVPMSQARDDVIWGGGTQMQQNIANVPRALKEMITPSDSTRRLAGGVVGTLPLPGSPVVGNVIAGNPPFPFQDTGIGQSYSGGPTQAELHRVNEVPAQVPIVEKSTFPPAAPTPPAPQPSLWDKMTEQAGTEAWDTRLYRLGEMMQHMGTPLSKRGKSPADRWSTASAATAKSKAAADKARISNLIKMADTSPKHMAEAIKPFLPEELDDYWFKFPEEEKQGYAMQIALRAQQAMLRAASEGKQMPMEVAMKLAANQIVKEKN